MQRARWIKQQRGRKAVLYVLRLTNAHEDFFTVGVTFDFAATWAALAPAYRRRLLAKHASYDALRTWGAWRAVCRRASCFPFEPAQPLPGKMPCFEHITWALAMLPVSSFRFGRYAAPATHGGGGILTKN